MIGAARIHLQGPARRAALLLHGFNDTPQSMAYLAAAVHRAGYTVVVPRLPGHGVRLPDMARDARSAQWQRTVAHEYAQLRASNDTVATLQGWAENSSSCSGCTIDHVVIEDGVHVAVFASPVLGLQLYWVRGDASSPVLRGEEGIEMRRSVARKGKPSRSRRTTPGAALPPADEGLLAQLKAWRTRQAREQSVPPYVVFHDSTLSAIAAVQPRDMDALAAIPGLGVKKLERYGPALLEVLRESGTA